jgi:hypothetical protein
MSDVTSGTSAGRQPIADILLVAFLKSIGARVPMPIAGTSMATTAPTRRAVLRTFLELVS